MTSAENQEYANETNSYRKIKNRPVTEINKRNVQQQKFCLLIVW